MDIATIHEKVNLALDAIRPFLHRDHGDVELVEITDDLVVKVKLQGNCVDCSMSAMTMKMGIEKSILRAIPEIKKVEAVNIPNPS